MAETILFLHGNSLSPETFNAQKAYFEDLGYNCIVPSLYTICDDLTPENYFNQLENLVSSIEEETPIDFMVGHSLGGHVAIETSHIVKNLKGIAIFGTPPISKPPKFEDAFLPVPELASFYNPVLSKEEIEGMAQLISPDYKEKIADWISNAHPNLRVSTGGAIASGLYSCETTILKNLKCPIAILHGENDPFLNLNYFKQINIPTLWRKDLQIVKDSTHMPQMENAEEFNRILSEFIDICTS